VQNNKEGRTLRNVGWSAVQHMMNGVDHACETNTNYGELTNKCQASGRWPRGALLYGTRTPRGRNGACMAKGWERRHMHNNNYCNVPLLLTSPGQPCGLKPRRQDMAATPRLASG